MSLLSLTVLGYESSRISENFFADWFRLNKVDCEVASFRLLVVARATGHYILDLVGLWSLFSVFKLVISAVVAFEIGEPFVL